MHTTELLETLRQRLVQRVGELRNDPDDTAIGGRQPESWRDRTEVVDPGETSGRAAVDDVRAEREAMQISEELYLEAALHRLALGDYGRCIDCHAQITPARLLADPATERCQPCQRQYEESPQRRRHRPGATT